MQDRFLDKYARWVVNPCIVLLVFRDHVPLLLSFHNLKSAGNHKELTDYSKVPSCLGTAGESILVLLTRSVSAVAWGYLMDE